MFDNTPPVEHSVVKTSFIQRGISSVSPLISCTFGVYPRKCMEKLVGPIPCSVVMSHFSVANGGIM